MAKEQWYVKSKGYQEIFDSVKLANTKFNKLKRELEEEEEQMVKSNKSNSKASGNVVDDLDREYLAQQFFKLNN